MLFLFILLVQQMLVYEPTSRISARNALSHQFFDSDVRRSIPKFPV